MSWKIKKGEDGLLLNKENLICGTWNRHVCLPAYSWYKLCISSRRHLSVFRRSGMHTICSQGERNSILVQSLLQVHLWCITHQQPRIRKWSGTYISCWTWNQGHHREHHFCFLPRFTTVDWEGWSTSYFYYDKRDDFSFNSTNFPFLSSNIPYSPAYDVFSSQLIRYTRACSSYDCLILRTKRLSSKIQCTKTGIPRETLEIIIQEVLWSIYRDLIKQYEVSLSRILNAILTLDQLQWLPNRSDFPPISGPWYRAWPSPNYEWFPWSKFCGRYTGILLSNMKSPSHEY